MARKEAEKARLRREYKAMYEPKINALKSETTSLKTKLTHLKEQREKLVEKIVSFNDYLTNISSPKAIFNDKYGSSADMENLIGNYMKTIGTATISVCNIADNCVSTADKAYGSAESFLEDLDKKIEQIETTIKGNQTSIGILETYYNIALAGI